MAVTAWLVANAVLAFYMLTPHRDSTFFIVFIILTAFLCSPFTLRTPVGRLWWTTYTLAILAAVGAVQLGGHNILGWLLAVSAACFYSLGVCLRWHPSTEIVS